MRTPKKRVGFEGCCPSPKRLQAVIASQYSVCSPIGYRHGNAHNNVLPCCALPVSARVTGLSPRTSLMDTYDLIIAALFIWVLFQTPPIYSKNVVLSRLRRGMLTNQRDKHPCLCSSATHEGTRSKYAPEHANLKNMLSSNFGCINYVMALFKPVN